MTTYNDVFGNSTVPPSEYGYSSVTLAATTTFVWPYNSDGGDTTSKIMNVTASSAGLAFILPPANEVSTGEDLLIRNVGVETFTVQANDTTPVVTVAAGESKYLYLTDNSTAAGSWGVISFGVGTSSVDAATLVGYGIKAIAATLNQAHEVYVSATDVTIDATFRSKVVVFTGGAGTVTFPASTVVGNDFFFLLRNSGTGTLTLTPDGAETIDALSSMDMQPGESALLFSSGSSWYTVGYGRSVAFNFTQLVKDLSAYSGGTVALTAAEASNKLLTFIGNPAAAVTVEVPAIVSVYYILNSLSTATSVTVEISGGTGVTVPQTQRIIAIADGTNVYSAQSVSASTTVSLLDGSAASPSLNFSSATSTGLFKYSVNGLGVTVNGSRVGFFDTTSCQIDTAFNVVGNLSVATNKFSVTASNGNTVWASGATLTLTGTTVSGGTFSSTTLTSPAINGTVTTTGLTLPAFAMGGAISNASNYAANFGTGALTAGAGTFSGNVTLGDASTNTVTVNGYMGVGGVGNASRAVSITSSALIGVSQIGYDSRPIFSSAATTNGLGVFTAPQTAAASFTMGNAVGYYANDWTKGAGSTITNQHGIYIDNQTQGTNNYGITSLVSSGTNKWNIYASGTAANYFAGGVRVGYSAAASAGGQLIVAADAGTLPTSQNYYNLIVKRNNTNDLSSGIAIVAGNSTGQARIGFGDADAIDDGAVIYDNSGRYLRFDTAGIERLRIDSAGNVTASTPTAAIGYGTGAGGTVTQGAGSGKATAVTLSKSTGTITMNNAALNSATTVSFTLTNTVIAATDMLVIQHISGGTIGAYTVNAFPGVGSAVISVRNVTAGNLSEAIVLRFAIVRSVDA